MDWEGFLKHVFLIHMLILFPFLVFFPSELWVVTAVRPGGTCTPLASLEQVFFQLGA